MKFIKRLTEPTKDNKYFFEDNFFQGKYGMPNCTAYAWGRAYEIMGTKPDLRTRADGIGNAKTWFGSKYCPYERGQEPRLGAIMCFDGTYGHVAVVEEIKGDNITVSQSSYGGPMFSTRTYKKGNYDHGSLKFQGFIYLPITIDEDTKTVDELAQEVLQGKWGNGQDRVDRLTNVGYNYNDVQNRVNEILHRNKKSIEEVARAVIRGEYGNGQDRVNNLTKAGYNYNEVQSKVNEILRNK